MSKLQLILLGHFDCLLPSGERISLSMRKAEVLLAYLALAPGIRHPRERLLNLLWSDRGEEQARNSLRQCLSTIKKSLGDVADLVVQVDRTTVRLIPDLVDVDALEFERLASDAGLEALSNAAALYAGEFLEGISIRDAACQDWLDAERSRFKRQYIEILTNLGHTLLASRELSKGIKIAEQLVAEDSLGESGWRLLMRAYSENGDRSHALQAFKRCQQALRAELDIDPEAETLGLRGRIAASQTTPAPMPPGDRAAQDIAAAQSRASTDEKAPVDGSPTNGHRIAVLPFDNLSGDPEQEYFSDGITDSIILNLSMFPDLQVKSRNSSFAFKQQIKSLGDISQELNVDYVVEGSIRKSSERIRITVQLIEAVNGNQIWGKRYDASIENLFDLEEELSRSIAATVTGQIESDLQRIALAKGAADQQAYDLLLAGIYHLNRSHREDIVIAIDKLEQCLLKDPDNVRAHAELYQCHIMNWMDRLVEDYQLSFELAGKHARKTLALGPDLGRAQYTYGEYLIFCREYDQAGIHLQKALTTNPHNPDYLTCKAMLLSMQGEFESGMELAERAYQLDPCNWWADWNLAEVQYLCHRFQDALDTIAKSRNAPGFIRIYSTAANVRLGRIDAARQSLQTYLGECRESMRAMPRSIDDWLRYTADTAPFADPQINQEIIDCLVQAGLEDTLTTTSTPADASEYPSIAVLPFTNLSGDAEQEYFSDGITASIILGLGGFKGLAVKSQNSSFAYRHSKLSSVEIAMALKADYLVEGSIRTSRNQVRLSVQLIEANSDNQIWGKQFDEQLTDILDLEQELSQAIAATISGRLGHSLQQSAARKPAKNLQSYDYLLRGLYHFGKFTADDLAIAKKEIVKCLDIDPDNATAHTNLGMIHSVEAIEGWSKDRTNSDKLARFHIETAIEIEPDNGLAHAYMSELQMQLGDYKRSEFHAERAIESNPNGSEGYVAKADLLAKCRRIDEAIPYADQALKLDPHSVGAGWIAGDVYRNAGQYEKAIKTFRSISHPPASIHALIATSFVGLDLLEEARKEMERYRKMARQQMSHYPQNEGAWRSLWRSYAGFQYEADFTAFFDLLLTAGLCTETGDIADDIPSIAVLPFENMSADPEQEFFNDGITTDIIATLSKFQNMRVISRHSTLQYKSRQASITDIASEQSVRYILEGSVRKSGEKIRVNAELIDVHSEQNIWSERYDRKLDNIFTVQDDITRNIAVALKVKLTDGERSASRTAGTRNVKAWELVLLATDLQDSYIRQNVLDARKMILQAIELDPQYAYARIGLGWTHWQEAYSDWTDSFEQSMLDATAAVEKALELDPDNAEAWILASTINITNNEPDKLITACNRALELEPGNAEVQALAGFAMNFVGDYEKATEHFNKALNLCPFCPNWYYLVGAQPHRDTGNLVKAEELLRRGITAEPDSPLCRFYLVDVLMEQGNEIEAQKITAEIRKLDKIMNGRGLARSYSNDAGIRDRFLQNLEKLGLA